MPGSESVRTCPHCKKNVYRIDETTEDRIIEALEKWEPPAELKNLRIYRRSDGTFMLAEGFRCTKLPVSILCTILITSGLIYFLVFNNPGLLQLGVLFFASYFLYNIFQTVFRTKNITLCLFTGCTSVLLLYSIQTLDLNVLRIAFPLLGILHAITLANRIRKQGTDSGNLKKLSDSSSHLPL